MGDFKIQMKKNNKTDVNFNYVEIVQSFVVLYIFSLKKLIF